MVVSRALARDTHPGEADEPLPQRVPHLSEGFAKVSREPTAFHARAPHDGGIADTEHLETVYPRRRIGHGLERERGRARRWGRYTFAGFANASGRRLKRCVAWCEQRS